MSSQILRPLLTLRHPPLQHLPIPHPEPDLKRLRLRRQRRRNTIALKGIQHRPIHLISGRHKLKRGNHSKETGIDLAIRQVAPNAHPRSGAIAVVRRAAALRVAEIPLREELLGVLEVAGVVVGGPRVHVEGCPRGDDRVVVRDVLDARAGEADRDDGPEAQDLFDQGGDVGDFFFVQAFLPRFAWSRVYLHDGVVGFFLDFLTLRGGEVAQCHDHVTGDGVDARGHHGQTDGFEFRVVEFGVGVFDDVSRDAGPVGAVCDAFL
jgi:hypothetical protein